MRCKGCERRKRVGERGIASGSEQTKRVKACEASEGEVANERRKRLLLMTQLLSKRRVCGSCGRVQRAGDCDA